MYVTYVTILKKYPITRYRWGIDVPAERLYISLVHNLQIGNVPVPEALASFFPEGFQSDLVARGFIPYVLS